MIETLEKEIKELEYSNKGYIRVKKSIPVKSFHGEVWKTNKTNKKYLAKDFLNRCCYCDDLDIYHGGYKKFHVEHFAPKNRFASLKNNYDNLLYCCPVCNGFKSDKWVGDSPSESIVDNIGFINPCDEEYYKHIVRYKDGRITYLTKLGKYIYEEIGLYINCHEINYKLDRIDEMTKKINCKLNEENLTEGTKNILLNIKSELFDKFRDYYMKNSNQ